MVTNKFMEGMAVLNKLIHLYYGDGKGKTTAAIGLTIRAIGANQKVFFTQFMKGCNTSEIEVLDKLEGITVLRSGKDFPFYQQMSEKDKKEITIIHDAILQQIINNISQIDLLILDEITYPYAWNLISKQKLKELFDYCKNQVEIVCTGRNPDTFFVDQADYITEMKYIKHPFDKGIQARKGIEF